MRALLVAAAPTIGSPSLVAELAANSDLVIAVDAGGTVCLHAGVTPNLVLGDFDSLPTEHLERLRTMGAEIVAHSPKKDETDLELALDEARRSGATEVVVTCATSDRLDHTVAVLGALARAADLRPEIAEPHLLGWVLGEGGRTTLSLNGLGATLSLLAVLGIAEVSAVGVEWPLTRATLLPMSGLGVSNIITSKAGALFTAHEGALLVLSPLAADAPRANRL